MKDGMLAPLLGAVGIVMVAGATTGLYGPPVELTVWVLIGIAWVVLALRFAQKPWSTVALTGAWSGVFAGIMQAALLAVLVSNNPAWSGTEVTAVGRAQAFGSALLIGIVWGLVFGGITWVVQRVSMRQKADEQVTAP